jgi:hypothetical protein
MMRNETVRERGKMKKSKKMKTRGMMTPNFDPMSEEGDSFLSSAPKFEF